MSGWAKGRGDRFGSAGWRRAIALGSMLAALFASASFAAAVAQDTADAPRIPAEMFFVLASDAPGAIDPRLSSLPQLRRPPFDGYGTLSLLDLHSADLEIGAPHDVTLPNGRVVRVVVERITDDGRYRVRVSINRPGETDYLPLVALLASPGVPFFCGGQRMEDGMLIVAVRLGAVGATAGSGS